jgi:hypothetical protein
MTAAADRAASATRVKAGEKTPPPSVEPAVTVIGVAKGWMCGLFCAELLV